MPGARIASLDVERWTLDVGRFLPALLKTPSLAAILVFTPLFACADPFFPTTTGTTWEYNQTGAEPGRLTVRIAGHESVNGKDLLKLETVAGDQIIKTDHLSATDRGLYCHQRRGHDGETTAFDPPRLFVPRPLQVGETWELEDEIGGTLMHQKFKVVAEETITVPAGAFRAYHLRCEQPWPISISVDRWFAPGTGFIKDITTTHGPTGRLMSRVQTVLTKFSSVAAPPPEQPPAASPPATATPTPSPKITLAAAKERNGEPATDFRSDALNIYVRWNGENLPTNSSVRVAWIAEDVGDVVEPNFIVDETETEVTAPESSARFTLSRPADGWAAGKYRLELYLDDELLETVRVTISD